jgi:hypothetical protein
MRLAVLTRLKLALGFTGLAVFLWGTRAEDARLRWVGIIVIAVALALRFLPPRVPPEGV